MKRVNQFISDSYEFRGEEYQEIEFSKRVLGAFLFLIIFISGCAATFSTSTNVEVSKKQRTER